MCALSTLTSDKIWAGNGSMNLRATTPTSAQAPVPTSAARTQPTARYGAGRCHEGTGAAPAGPLVHMNA